MDRLKAVPAEEMIRWAEALKLAPTGQLVPAPSNKVQGSSRPDLKPKTTLDFLFKSCEMDFKDSLSLLDQVLDQQAKRQHKRPTLRRELGMSRSRMGAPLSPFNPSP